MRKVIIAKQVWNLIPHKWLSRHQHAQYKGSYSWKMFELNIFCCHRSKIVESKKRLHQYLRKQVLDMPCQKWQEFVFALQCEKFLSTAQELDLLLSDSRKSKGILIIIQSLNFNVIIKQHLTNYPKKDKKFLHEHRHGKESCFLLAYSTCPHKH